MHCKWARLVTIPIPIKIEPLWECHGYFLCFPIPFPLLSRLSNLFRLEMRICFLFYETSFALVFHRFKAKRNNHKAFILFLPRSRYLLAQHCFSYLSKKRLLLRMRHLHAHWYVHISVLSAMRWTAGTAKPNSTSCHGMRRSYSNPNATFSLCSNSFDSKLDEQRSNWIRTFLFLLFRKCSDYNLCFTLQ